MVKNCKNFTKVVQNLHEKLQKIAKISQYEPKLQNKVWFI